MKIHPIISNVLGFAVFLSICLENANALTERKFTDEELKSFELAGQLQQGQSQGLPTYGANQDNGTDFEKVGATEENLGAEDCACGKRQIRGSDEERIVGGIEAEVNEFPWRCNLRLRKTSGEYIFFCGCSVVNNKFILTAAHCTDAVKGYQIYVDMGDHDLDTDSESANQIIPVRQVYQHEKYNRPSKFNNDIAMLELASTSQVNRYNSPVCLPYKFQGKVLSKATVTASGWGTEKEGNKQTPSKLRKVDLPLLTTEECRTYLGRQITDNMICTYQTGKDTCQGDSGGSIDYKDPNSDRYYSVGIVSFGDGCAKENKPGAYTKITNYLNWIDNIVGNAGLCKN